VLLAFLGNCGERFHELSSVRSLYASLCVSLHILGHFCFNSTMRSLFAFFSVTLLKSREWER
jgi:hypothetical protein